MDEAQVNPEVGVGTEDWHIRQRSLTGEREQDGGWRWQESGSISAEG